MIAYVVPHSIYPAGYYTNPKEPVPFISITSQKNHVALYHMRIIIYPDISAWFKVEYPKQVKTKLDMGMICIRFKKMENIPYGLIAELCRKITLEEHLIKYELELKKKRRNNKGHV